MYGRTHAQTHTPNGYQEGFYDMYHFQVCYLKLYIIVQNIIVHLILGFYWDPYLHFDTTYKIIREKN